MKILIIRLSSLGDIVLLQPVCAMLQTAYPEAEITLICKEAYQELPLMFNPPIKVIRYQKSLSFHLRMMADSFNLVLDLHGKFASWLLSWIIPASSKLVYNKQRSLRKKIVAGKTDAAINSSVDLYTSALEPLGISTTWKAPSFVSPQINQKSRIDDYGPFTIAIIPGATHFTKRYPSGQWVTFMKMHPTWQFRLFGDSGDKDLIAAMLQGSSENCVSYAGKLNLRQLHQELAACDLIISGDTGPMHLAATFNKPQIAIFGGTHPRLGFRPLNPKAIVLCAELPCQPCSLHGCAACPQGHFACMTQITPLILSEQAEQVLGCNR